MKHTINNPIDLAIQQGNTDEFLVLYKELYNALMLDEGFSKLDLVDIPLGTNYALHPELTVAHFAKISEGIKEIIPELLETAALSKCADIFLYLESQDKARYSPNRFKLLAAGNFEQEIQKYWDGYSKTEKHEIVRTAEFRNAFIAACANESIQAITLLYLFAKAYLQPTDYQFFVRQIMYDCLLTASYNDQRASFHTLLMLVPKDHKLSMICNEDYDAFVLGSLSTKKFLLTLIPPKQHVNAILAQDGEAFVTSDTETKKWLLKNLPQALHHKLIYAQNGMALAQCAYLSSTSKEEEIDAYIFLFKLDYQYFEHVAYCLMSQADLDGQTRISLCDAMDRYEQGIRKEVIGPATARLSLETKASLSR